VTYGQIIDRLSAIEADLEERQGAYEQAAEDKHRLVRDYELRFARAFMAAEGKTATERKAQATLAVAAAEDDLYARLLDAEGRYEGLKAAIRVLEQRAMIGMSLSKSQTRESGPSPQWSGGDGR
jgi:hypothetical protein